MTTRFLSVLGLLICWTVSAQAAGGMVVSAQALATQSGVAMLAQGGNAFDAAAAVALDIGVVEPAGSGIGGGGFFLLYIAKENRYVMLDARETSPRLAGHGGVYKAQSSIDGAQSAGVPGLIAGVDYLIKRYGRLARTKIAAPAIRHARDGFQVSARYRNVAKWRQKVLATSQAGDIYLNRGNVPDEGYLIRQTALAETLERFSRYGADDFYLGQTAGRLVADMKRDGGLIRESDLAAYRVIERQPVTFSYKGHRVVSAALPSSGGLVLAEIFGMLGRDDLAAVGESDRVHLLTEVMRRAYRDRAAYLGDVDFVSPPDDLLKPARLRLLREGIDIGRATPSTSLPPALASSGDGANTTHFSVIDAEGNMVAATLSINYGFGSGYVSPSTGILLNDEMDDFVTRPGEANAYGLVGSTANHVAPGKRMLSSMSPTFVIGPERTLITGTPGGSRIISMVLHGILAFVEDSQPPEAWLKTPRFHHQYLPDEIQHEPGAFSVEVAESLQNKGHKVRQIRSYGNMQAIVWNREKGTYAGLVDPRGEGAAAAFPASAGH